MFINLIGIVVGIALVLWGADRLTEGASQLARRMNVPEIVIGLTIVACGTSAPEFFVSVTSALQGTPDLAVGNVVGSNIFNTMLIVGVSALVAPMVLKPSTVKSDMPFSVLASILLVLMCLDGFEGLDLAGHSLSRWDGILLLAVFALFMWHTFRMAKTGATDTDAGEQKTPSPWLSALFVVMGLGCLVYGSDLFVSKASEVARALDVSEAVIGLTIVAGGTSLPELATSVVAARKGQSAMAIGNVIGSNVFNVLFILGTTAVICPMQIQGITMVDLSVMLGSVCLLWMFSYTKYTVERWEGAVLTVLFFAYLAWLLYNI